MKPLAIAALVLLLLQVTLAPLLAVTAQDDAPAFGSQPCCCSQPVPRPSCCDPEEDGVELAPVGCTCCVAPDRAPADELPELPPDPAPRVGLPNSHPGPVEASPAPCSVGRAAVERSGAAPPGIGPPARILFGVLRL